MPTPAALSLEIVKYIRNIHPDIFLLLSNDFLGAEAGAGAIEVGAARWWSRLGRRVALVYSLEFLSFVSCAEWVAAYFPGKIATLFFGRKPLLGSEVRQLLSC